MPIFYLAFGHILYLILNAVFWFWLSFSVSNTKIVYATLYNLLALVIYIYYKFKYLSILFLHLYFLLRYVRTI